MAKMFYTLEEAAQTLGVSEDQVKTMASEGKVQQFRDRDKLMFKREEIDGFAANGKTESDGPIPLTSPDDSGDTGETDAIDLNEQTSIGGVNQDTAAESADPTQSGTGMNVFETGEFEAADPMAQTQVTRSSSDDSQSISDDEELSLESVGSGSGLLDLTRESDDTSLGAELLDEIYPGGGSEAGGSQTGIGGTGVFDSAAGMDTSDTGTATGLDSLGGSATAAPAAQTGAAPIASTPYQQTADQGDPLWSGLSAGLLLGSTIALILGLIVAISSIAGMTSIVTSYFIDFGVAVSAGVLLLVCIILGIVGALVGRATGS